MKRAPTPLLVTRVYPQPGRSGLYVRVSIYRSRAEMHAACRANGEDPGGRRTVGLCASFTRRQYRSGRYHRTDAIVSEVRLYRRRLGVLVVAHELLHATIAWGRRVGRPMHRWMRPTP